MALLIEAGQMTASDYVPTYPKIPLASKGASTDAIRSQRVVRSDRPWQRQRIGVDRDPMLAIYNPVEPIVAGKVRPDRLDTVENDDDPCNAGFRRLPLAIAVFVKIDMACKHAGPPNRKLAPSHRAGRPTSGNRIAQGEIASGEAERAFLDFGNLRGGEAER